MLIIDTTKQNTYLALVCDEKVYKKTLQVQTKVSESLLPAIEQVLQEASIDLNNIECLCVVTGPGSFTGIRVGLATIKAFAQALDLKVINRNSFEVILNSVDNGVILFKCTNSSQYFAKLENHQIVEVGVIANSELNKFDKIQVYELVNEASNLEIGTNKIENYIDILVDYFTKEGKKADYQLYSTIEPYYLQLSQAELNLNDEGKK